MLTLFLSGGSAIWNTHKTCIYIRRSRHKCKSLLQCLTYVLCSRLLVILLKTLLEHISQTGSPSLLIEWAEHLCFGGKQNWKVQQIVNTMAIHALKLRVTGVRDRTGSLCCGSLSLNANQENLKCPLMEN